MKTNIIAILAISFVLIGCGQQPGSVQSEGSVERIGNLMAEKTEDFTILENESGRFGFYYGGAAGDYETFQDAEVAVANLKAYLSSPKPKPIDHVWKTADPKEAQIKSRVKLLEGKVAALESKTNNEIHFIFDELIATNKFEKFCTNSSDLITVTNHGGKWVTNDSILIFE